MTIHRQLAPVLVLVLAASARTASAESARFKYQLRPGASYETTLKVSLALQLEAEGLPEDVASMVLAGKDIAEQVKVLVRLDVSPAAPDGTLTVRGKFEDLYTKMTMGGASFESSDFKDQLERMGPLEGRVLADGRAVELALPKVESDLPAPARDALSRLIHVLPAFPDRDLAVGDRFDVPFRFDMPALPAAGDTKFDGTCVYTLAGLGERDADFTVRCSMSAVTSDAAQNMKMSITGGSEGSARFDRVEGIFRTFRSDLAVDMAMEMKPEKERTEMEGAEKDATSTEPRLIKIRASAKGPLELTMERNPAEK